MKRAVFWILIALAVVQTARMTWFMFDDTKREMSPTPWDHGHLNGPNNLTAYIETALLAYELRGHEGLNVYDEDRNDLKSSWATDNDTLDRYNIGHFHYPPQFMSLPWAFTRVTHDFSQVRGVWFLFEAAVVLLALVMLARHVGGREGSVMRWMIPLFWIALPVMFDFQVQNFQMVAVAGAVIAMIMFDRDKPAIGGAVLAFVTLSKIFPGILLLYLLVRRRWHALAWTVVFFAVFTALALLLFGAQPFSMFVHYELPRISSTEAFNFFRDNAPFSTYYNFSVLGVMSKLEQLGLGIDAWAAAPRALWVYSFVLGGATVFAATHLRLRATEPVAPSEPTLRLVEAQVWLVLIAASELRSPMATQPQVYLGTLWLLCTIATRLSGRSLPWWLLFGATWLAFNLILPVPWTALGVTATTAITLGLQLVVFGLIASVFVGLARRHPYGWRTLLAEALGRRKPAQ